MPDFQRSVNNLAELKKLESLSTPTGASCKIINCVCFYLSGLRFTRIITLLSNPRQELKYHAETRLSDIYC